MLVLTRSQAKSQGEERRESNKEISAERVDQPRSSYIYDDTWTSPIIEHLVKGILPSDIGEARKIRR